jgi:hypothetical protein
VQCGVVKMLAVKNIMPWYCRSKPRNSIAMNRRRWTVRYVVGRARSSSQQKTYVPDYRIS